MKNALAIGDLKDDLPTPESAKIRNQAKDFSIAGRNVLSITRDESRIRSTRELIWRSRAEQARPEGKSVSQQALY